MIEIDFESFHNQNYIEKGYELYVMKNGNSDVLYVGISNRSIWERWFGWNGHVMWTDNRISGESPVGQKIVDHLPESLQWKIQLWTLKDCISFCKNLLSTRSSCLDIQYIESFMIQKLSPILNETYNLNPGKGTTPESKQENRHEKILDDAYNKVFNKK